MAYFANERQLFVNHEVLSPHNNTIDKPGPNQRASVMNSLIMSVRVHNLVLGLIPAFQCCSLKKRKKKSWRPLEQNSCEGHVLHVIAICRQLRSPYGLSSVINVTHVILSVRPTSISACNIEKPEWALPGARLEKQTCVHTQAHTHLRVMLAGECTCRQACTVAPQFDNVNIFSQQILSKLNIQIYGIINYLPSRERVPCCNLHFRA